MPEGSFPLSFLYFLVLPLSFFSRHRIPLLNFFHPPVADIVPFSHLYTDVDVVFLHCYRLSVALPQT